MYEHHIREMATSLVEAGLATDQKQVELVLSRYWEDKVAVVWTNDDVHSVQDDFDEDEQTSSLSEEQAQSILQRAFDKHDANVGITWESLRFWSEELAEETIT
jgi:hypothetical protein